MLCPPRSVLAIGLGASFSVGEKKEVKKDKKKINLDAVISISAFSKNYEGKKPKHPLLGFLYLEFCGGISANEVCKYIPVSKGIGI